MLLAGPMNGPALLAYAAQVLSPELCPGDIVIMDNLPSHTISGAQGHRERRYTAPVPADLFAGLQSDRDGLLEAQGAASKSRRPHHRRSVGRHRRLPPGLQTRECRNYFTAAGYDPE
jgi:hypothetical protein